jgi:hypothetical protein
MTWISCSGFVSKRFKQVSGIATTYFGMKSNGFFVVSSSHPLFMLSYCNDHSMTPPAFNAQCVSHWFWNLYLVASFQEWRACYCDGLLSNGSCIIWQPRPRQCVSVSWHAVGGFSRKQATLLESYHRALDQNSLNFHLAKAVSMNAFGHCVTWRFWSSVGPAIGCLR